jgi:hypothetical protein
MRIRVHRVCYCFVPLTVLVACCSCATAIAASLAEFQGHVVDDESGESVTDFWVQLGAATPQKPREISWSQEFYGPVLGQPGFFSFQSIKKGKTWARVLATGYVPQPVTTEPVVSPIRITNLVVRLKRGAELRGILLDYAGRAVAGARVFLATEQSLDLTDGNPQGTFRGSTVITDVGGRFALRGVRGTEQRVIAVSADGLPAWIVAKAEPGQDLKVTMPEPATLAVRYDIPDDEQETKIRLQLRTWTASEVGVRTFVRQSTLANGGQVLMTGLPMGTYDLARPKMLRVGTETHGVFCDRATVTLQPGQTQQVNFVRSAGFPIRGQVVGLRDANAPGAFIYVRSVAATGDPRKMFEESELPMFDAVACDEAGRFSTARLEPGNYTIVAHAFKREAPSRAVTTGIRLPDYIGTVKVTVGADAPRAPVMIELRPLSRLQSMEAVH